MKRQRKRVVRLLNLLQTLTLDISSLATTLFTLTAVAEAEDVLRRASERKMEAPFLSLLRFDLAFLKGDSAGMQREVAAAQG